jgi:hypothetical protein
MVTMPVPNTGPAKFLWAAGGLAAGTAAAFGLNAAFVTPERDKELERDKGTSRWNSSETRYMGMAAAYGVGSGIALGLSRRSGTTGLTTAAHVAMGALLSTVAGGTINLDKSEAYMQGIGFMLAGVGAGALVSVRDEAARLPLRGASLACMGAAVGMMVPSMVSAAQQMPGDALRGLKER